MQALTTKMGSVRAAMRRCYTTALEEFPYPNLVELKAGYKPTPSEQARIAAAQEKAAAAAKEWAARKVHVESHAVSTTDTWKKIAMFIALPATIAIAVNSFVVMPHQHFKGHDEYIAYPHLRKRVKAFPWGDGDTVLFKGHHNF